MIAKDELAGNLRIGLFLACKRKGMMILFGAASMMRFELILKKILKNDRYLIAAEWQARGGAWHRAPEEVLKDAPPEAGAGGANTQKE